MSLRLTSIGFVPEDTARVARAAFPKGSAWLLLRDELGTIFTDAAFASLFPRRGQPAEAPWRLALVTLLQYAENLWTARRRTPCAAASTGSISWGWS